MELRNNVTIVNCFKRLKIELIIEKEKLLYI